MPIRSMIRPSELAESGGGAGLSAFLAVGVATAAIRQPSKVYYHRSQPGRGWGILAGVDQDAQ